MDARMTGVRLTVQDMERSCAFYEKLGWKKSSLSISTISAFQLGGAMLSLWREDIIQNELGLAAPPKGGAGSIIIDHHVGDEAAVETVLSQVEAAGGQIVCKASDGPLGANTYGCFADPDGHIWRVVFSRMLTVDENGLVSLPE